MPHSTFAFPFEGRIVQWADRLAVQFTGDHRSFLATFDSRGEMRSMVLGADVKREEAYPGWLFYDPFDLPEYCFLEWHGLTQATVERLIGAPFLPEDFQALPHRSEQVALDHLPSSWSVMF